MPFDPTRARPLLQQGNLPKLFVEELGWEPVRQKSLTLRVKDRDFTLAAQAEKKGFTVWLCESLDGSIPDHATRLSLDRKLTETSFEHLLVFTTPERARQSWLWVRRESGKPIAARTHEYHRGQPGDSLLQKLQALYVSLEEEEQGDLNVLELSSRARTAFDLEKVTKKFYKEFDAHRQAFLKFIDGIDEKADKEWYASVMLNRLMFVYFIQKKGFLDGDTHYLRNRLQRCQQEKGKDKFYSFYRFFLLRLFHEGFGKRQKERAADLEKLLGVIPYLNGGLFDVHELEKPERYGKHIQIPDKAFERVFDYFDQYQWHLDERPLRQDNEINPDVLGYIFEKYINQKQMGAYYTKEDITEYIGKNTILPFLFDAAQAKCKVAFDNPDGPTVWDNLREDPDRYIYAAVRHGVGQHLPPEIAAGLNPPGLKDPVPAGASPDDIPTLRLRKDWNKPAPESHALPTETWREHIHRRQRCEELRRKLAAGEVRSINDFITLNLDIRQFAQDVLTGCEGPDLLSSFWNALRGVTILDPTGGSGAFLFAALNILDPLYVACLDRMEGFLGEWGEPGRKTHPNYHKRFTETLAQVAAHPNRRYFILKSIILNNLYAVDIMEEAVEICKLRLFLKLAAQVEPDPTKDNLGIEPLPDMDFNIRAGNTLVGYATEAEVRRCMQEFGGGQMKLLDDDELNSFARFNTRCADVQEAFDAFRRHQTESDGSVPAADKLELQRRLKALEDEMNRHLAGEYGVRSAGVAPSNSSTTKASGQEARAPVAYEKWLNSHQPFHWFVQFYGIIQGGGFDVIIGNPPWLENSVAKKSYSVRGYATEPSGNLYALCTERSLTLLARNGYLSFIVQLPIVSSSRMDMVRDMMSQNAGLIVAITCDDRPGKLFEGLQHCRSTIFTIQKCGGAREPQLWSSGYRRWATSVRSSLLPMTIFSRVDEGIIRQLQFPKLASPLHVSSFSKLFAQARHPFMISSIGGTTDNFIFYQESAQYWVKATVGASSLREKWESRRASTWRYMYFENSRVSRSACAVLNSSLFYAYFIAYGDCFHVSHTLASKFPVPPEALDSKPLQSLGKKLMLDLERNAETKTIATKDGDRISYAEFRVSESKSILDEIDTVLAHHYGFTAEELDFIVNYDIKYRLGREAGGEEE